MAMIKRVRSGGQSGVDRAALDIARKFGVPITGWCPKGGWAEDFPIAPGLLNDYPELIETPSKRVEQRTEWNARDADATLIVNPILSSESLGTDFTIESAKKHNRPFFVARDKEDLTKVIEWIDSLEGEIELNVGGPRHSECSEGYELTQFILSALLTDYIVKQ